MNDLSNLIGRQPSMTLLSGPLCALSHSCRIVLNEKDIECSINYVSANDDPSIIGQHNPYGEVPTLLDRGISFYDTSVILEYLDERFPHPPLMPADPITRAKTRLMIARLTRDWLRPISNFGDKLPWNVPAKFTKEVHDGLIAMSPLFSHQSFFLGLEYTLVDTYLGPLLWRLPALGIELPKQADVLTKYSERLFARAPFIKSLSKQEAEIRDL